MLATPNYVDHLLREASDEKNLVGTYSVAVRASLLTDSVIVHDVLWLGGLGIASFVIPVLPASPIELHFINLFACSAYVDSAP